MFTSILNTVVENASTTSLTLQQAIVCTITSIILGFIISKVYMMQDKPSKKFAVSLVILPVLVQTVIMLVNGNLGAGVAVLGTFSLVRFRSLPGSSKEICSIFFAMAVGLATGMGYITFAVLITIIINLLLLILAQVNYGAAKIEEKELKIVIAESLDYTDVFDDIFEKYLNKVSLERVKTTNMGSMYELKYNVILKDEAKEKEMIDALRCRNGNLTIMCSRAQLGKEEL